MITNAVHGMLSNYYYNVYYARKFMYYVVHLLFYCMLFFLILFFHFSFYFVLSIFTKWWEVPRRSHADLIIKNVTCLPNTPTCKVININNITSSTWLYDIQPPHRHTQG